MSIDLNLLKLYNSKMRKSDNIQINRGTVVIR